MQIADDLRDYRIITVREDADEGSVLLVRRHRDRRPWICWGDGCGGQRWPAERQICGYCGLPREEGEL